MIVQFPSRKPDPISSFVENLAPDRRDWFDTPLARRTANTWQIQEYTSQASAQAEGDPRGAAVYFDTQSNAIFEVHGDIYAKYKSMGAEQSQLGFPVSNEEPWQSDEHGRQSQFQHGTITWLRQTRQTTVVNTININVLKHVTLKTVQ